MGTGRLPPGEPDTIGAAIAEHPFCREFGREHLVAMASGAAVVHLDADSFVIRRGQPATALHLITDGTVSLEVADPGGEPFTIETLHAGEALGWSWLFPERTWRFDGRCVSDVETIAVDAGHLRGLIEEDPVFGRDLVLRISRVVMDRLVLSRAQLVNIQHHDRR
jgi:CRP/FNR family transcriptional regulator, cyclic AMP receptor protein